MQEGYCVLNSRHCRENGMCKAQNYAPKELVKAIRRKSSRSCKENVLMNGF